MCVNKLSYIGGYSNLYMKHYHAYMPKSKKVYPISTLISVTVAAAMTNTTTLMVIESHKVENHCQEL